MEENRRQNLSQRLYTFFGRLTVTFIGVAILLELISFSALWTYDKLHRDPLVPQNSPAYDRESWGREFWAEQTMFWSQARSDYFPFTVWGVRRWHGKFINTDETELGTWRRTTQAMGRKCAKQNVRTVWVFGGSTVFGIGTPDWATIPSFLAKELNADPSACVEVVNFGVEGYVTNQEAILLMEQLKAGRKPEVAIFYDGVNESLVGGFSPGIPTLHWNFETIKAKFEGRSTQGLAVLKMSYTLRLIRLLMGGDESGAHAAIPDKDLASRAQATLRNYQENLKIIRMLASAYGFRAYFFWQPVLAFENKPLSQFEKRLTAARSQELEGRVHRGLRAVYEQAENRAASGGFAFLGHTFDNIEDTIYVDEFHLDPRGNEMIAHAIAQTMRKDFATDKAPESH